MHGTDLSEEDKITDTLLDSKINMCNTTQEQNSKNITKLSDSTMLHLE